MITVDFNQLAQNWLRTKLRTTNRLQLIYNFISPIVALNTLFLAFASAILAQSQYTCQTMSLAGALNDALDPTDRRIYIVNSVNTYPVNFIFRRSDAKPTFIYRRADMATPFYLYRRADYLSTYDFIVMYPAAASFTASQLATLYSLTNQYKKAGKRPSYQSF